MNASPYLVSLAVGIGVGVLYGLLNTRSPAPPIIALLGLLGMLAGEAFVSWAKSRITIEAAAAECLHSKQFTARTDDKPSDTA